MWKANCEFNILKLWTGVITCRIIISNLLRSIQWQSHSIWLMMMTTAINAVKPGHIFSSAIDKVGRRCPRGCRCNGVIFYMLWSPGYNPGFHMFLESLLYCCWMKVQIKKCVVYPSALSILTWCQEVATHNLHPLLLSIYLEVHKNTI